MRRVLIGSIAFFRIRYACFANDLIRLEQGRSPKRTGRAGLACAGSGIYKQPGRQHANRSRPARTFVVIAEEQHFTRATEWLHIRMPAASALLRPVEERLKTKALFTDQLESGTDRRKRTPGREGHRPAQRGLGAINYVQALCLWLPQAQRCCCTVFWPNRFGLANACSSRRRVWPSAGHSWVAESVLSLLPLRRLNMRQLAQPVAKNTSHT
jgi:hypothetical protein